MSSLSIDVVETARATRGRYKSVRMCLNNLRFPHVSTKKQKWKAILRRLKSSDQITFDAGKNGNARLGWYMQYFRPHKTCPITPKLLFWDITLPHLPVLGRREIYGEISQVRKKGSNKAGNTVLARILFPIPILTSIFCGFPQSQQVDARVLSRTTPSLHFC